MVLKQICTVDRAELREGKRNTGNVDTCVTGIQINIKVVYSIDYIVDIHVKKSRTKYRALWNTLSNG